MLAMHPLLHPLLQRGTKKPHRNPGRTACWRSRPPRLPRLPRALSQTLTGSQLVRVFVFFPPFTHNAPLVSVLLVNHEMVCSYLWQHQRGSTRAPLETNQDLCFWSRVFCFGAFNALCSQIFKKTKQNKTLHQRKVRQKQFKSRRAQQRRVGCANDMRSELWKTKKLKPWYAVQEGRLLVQVF